MPTPPNFWAELFAAPAAPGKGIQVEMRLLKKGGRPLLLLPSHPRAAAASLDLYPAQTVRARAARTLLRGLLRASLPLGTERASFAVSPEDPFVSFLSSLAREPTQRLPALGILAGNPMSDGQRFLLLVFDAGQHPVAVVKAGLSQRARILIQQEGCFLTAVPGQTAAVPRLRANFESSRVRALALDFFPGDSPLPRDEAAIPSLLSSWVDPKRTIVLSETPDWQRLHQAASANALFPVVATQLRERTIHPAIHHGDFAPWNIKVSPAGAWKVLDWERGEVTGLPGWDWFHYVIQSGILVGRLSAPVVVQRVESLLRSEAFQQYAAHASILGCERDLVLAYLLHVVEVLKPSEGLGATDELLKALSTRWRKA
jgi:hypothetical protein